MRDSFASSTPRGPLSFRLAMRVDSICDRLESDKSRLVAARPDPIAVARRVDALCEAFEEAWRLGEKPRVEDFLPSRDDAAWSSSLRELVVLERELRCAEGESASPTEYRERFLTIRGPGGRPDRVELSRPLRGVVV